MTLPETVDLLSISRHGRCDASKPQMNAYLGKKLIVHAERPNGGTYPDKYRLTDLGFDKLFASPHFDEARVKLDALWQDDSDDEIDEEACAEAQ